MVLFNFLKKARPIDFSPVYIQRLSAAIDSLATTLREAGFSFYITQLYQIKSSALNKDEETFKKLVISRDFFGGSGALWEIYMDNSELQAKFYHQFRDFVIQLQAMGIKNQRINQTKKLFDKIIRINSFC